MAGAGTHAYVDGASTIDFLDFYVTHTENMKTCGASFVNTLLNGGSLMPVCSYNTEFESSYADESWLYNVGALIANNAAWYGYA